MTNLRLASLSAFFLAAAGGVAMAQMGVPKPSPTPPGQQAPQQGTPPPPALPPQTAAALAGTATAAGTSPNAGIVPLSLQNASLTQVVDLLAQHLKINYLIDPKVKGNVILNSYGEMKELDPKALLETILRINGAGIVKVGNLWRIVPLNDMPHQPLEPETLSKDTAADDQVMLNLLFLKYTTVDELVKVLKEFVGEGAVLVPYAPANLLFIQDNRRSMRRTMELVSLFDSNEFANQRVRLFDVKNGKPSDIAKELDTVMKSIAMTDKNSPVKFLPVDRINLLIAVAPNPGVFDTVETWLRKLDVPLKATAGEVDTYVYSLRYQRAECIAMSLMQLYGGLYGGGGGGGYGGYGGYGGGGYGGYGGGGYGGGGYGGGGGGYGGGLNPLANVQSNTGLGAAFSGGCGGLSSMGGGGYGGGGYGGGFGGGFGGYGGGGYGGYPGAVAQPGTAPLTAAAPADQTGSYLGNKPAAAATHQPRIVPNATNNSLLIMATPQEYLSLTKLLKQLDVPPRQILLEAKIYEVDLSGAWSSGVTAYLQALAPGTPRQAMASLVGAATTVTAGMLVGKSRELLGTLQLQENSTRAKVISAPSLIATDGIPASINVGNAVPTLAAVVPSGSSTNGTSDNVESVSTQNTGVTLNVLAQINPSGVVTLIINQEVSAPEPPATGGIQSPSFSKRTVQTQITMQNGDTIAIGGIITEDKAESVSGIPILDKIPVIGPIIFGSKSVTTDRTELIVFITPHVIFDNTDLIDASEELKTQLKKLLRVVRFQ